MSIKGIAASAQPLASQAGVRILDQGGNAADAAVAMAAALNVTEPCSTGIGGDAFCLYYDAKTKGIRAFNGSGRTPKAMTLDKLRAAGIEGQNIPLLSIHAATVPGAPALWVDAVEKLGSGKVDLKQVLAPAIDLAENGYPVHEIVSHAWQRQEGQIRDASPSGGDMLLDGKAPLPGEVMSMPHLAQTFRDLAAKGKDGFYKGRVAEAIVELHKSKGGLMAMEDLEEHGRVGSEEVKPISYTYTSGTQKDTGGVTLHECPPNGQGLTALIALGILDSLQESGTIPPLSSMDHNSAEYLHPIIEALRLAFADTMWYVADEQHVHVPVKELLSKEYLAKRAKIFDPKRASEIKRGHPTSSSDTVYFSVVDKEGNACSFINSNCTCGERSSRWSLRIADPALLRLRPHRCGLRNMRCTQGLRLHAAEQRSVSTECSHCPLLSAFLTPLPILAPTVASSCPRALRIALPPQSAHTTRSFPLSQPGHPPATSTSLTA